MYEISGVHHIAIGIKNNDAMNLFYKEILGFNDVHHLLPDTSQSPHEDMSYITRGVIPVFSASMLSQGDNSIFIEFIHMSTPVPHAIRSDFRYGDIGANKIMIAVSDVKSIYIELKDKVNFCSGPKSVDIPGWGVYNFIFCKDPEGNLVEFASGLKLPVKNKFGGIRWIGIGVTDIKRSADFYKKYAGFDSAFINTHESFSGLVDEVSGAKQTKVRSCILSSSKGGGMLELIEFLEPRGRSIPSYIMWGDFGYLQTALICKNVPEIADRFEKEGFEFIVKIKRMPGDQGAAFTYIRDPDGIPVEFLSFGK